MRTPLVRRPRPHARATAFGLGALLLGVLSTPDALAQPSVDLGGLAYLDYSYVFDSFDEEEEGANTFDYRRLYLTADFTLSDAFDGRIRLEAKGTSTTAQGRPAPFVKDAYLTWNDPLGDGSRLRMGLQPPPLYEIAEDVWGYRSLEATLQDRLGVGDSRDLGLRGDLPLAEAFRLSVMVGNGNGLRPEDDREAGKHAYAQLQLVPDDAPLRATLGADFARSGGMDEPRTDAVKTSAFVGAVTDRFHGGIEGFYLRTTTDVPASPETDGFGVSVFGAVNLSARTSLVGRYDLVEADLGREGETERYALAAFVYRPDPRVELMPNVLIDQFHPDGPIVVGRFTVHARF